LDLAFPIVQIWLRILHGHTKTKIRTDLDSDVFKGKNPFLARTFYDLDSDRSK